MKLVCNGFPKSGNHALWKACELLGVPSGVNHLTYAEGIPQDATHHVFIERDPRDVIVSWLRFTHRPVTPGTFLSALRSFDDGPSLIDAMAAYEPWLRHESTLVVRFEDLIASDLTMRAIASYLGVPYLDGAFDELPGMTKTWNAKHSNHRIVWTDQVAQAWVREGGDDLIARWGY
ncbi:MAG: hypothetical protein IT518_04685 [Burkholderiales bacterium]|nr:hypothetical protein [Burkholderiales bacterium]